MLRRRLVLPVAAFAAVLASASPAGAKDRLSTGNDTTRVRDGLAVVQSDSGWQAWDLRKGRVGPLHGGLCEGTQLALTEWGRDAGADGTVLLAFTMGPQPEFGVVAAPGQADPLCRIGSQLADPDKDGQVTPGLVQVVRLKDLGRTPEALPTLQLLADEAPSGLWTVGDDVWLGLDGGDRYVRLTKGARRWSAPVEADKRPSTVDPDRDATSTQLLDDGAVWQWTYDEGLRKGRVRILSSAGTRLDRRPKASWSIKNPFPRRMPVEPGLRGACKSPAKLLIGGPSVAFVDSAAKAGWGLSDGLGTWTCPPTRFDIKKARRAGEKAKPYVFAETGLTHLMRTANGGRSWRLVRRFSNDSQMVALLDGRPLLERRGADDTDCPTALAVYKDGRTTDLPCRPA
ncbi:hypothetical protein [Conexibacter sp. SYSU D00693]|uniref:hypothetical protein n=1 Tax=Conexibacter sp. SYSU D00693 TaxID=2812560 RepID=UPI00196B5FC0|nr:hypothetical protein [Conexibacter sp. SYSU D00693]